MFAREPALPREPAINIPGLLVAFLLLLLAIQAVRPWLDPELDLKLVLDGGFIPARLSLVAGWTTPEELLGRAGEGGGLPTSGLDGALAAYVAGREQAPVPFVLTYALLHGSWTHVVMNVVWLAAFGAPVVRRCGTLRSLVLAAATAAGAAAAYWLVDPLGTGIVIGASGIASGFMGAAATFVFAPGGSMLARSRGHGDARPAGPLGFLRNRNAAVFLALWFLVNIVVGLLGARLGLADGGIAWQAHIGGLLTGLFLFPLLGVPRPSRRD